jgi:hypothetical protein
MRMQKNLMAAEELFSYKINKLIHLVSLQALRYKNKTTEPTEDRKTTQNKFALALKSFYHAKLL